MLNAELITSIDGLEALHDPWTELALATRRPMTRPEWMLSWLRHLGPREPIVRSVAVYEGAQLVGLVPLFVDLSHRGRTDYRVLGADASRNSLLAPPGREWEVAAAAAPVLARAEPRPDLIALECGALSSAWAAALVAGWPGRAPRPITYVIKPSPVVHLEANSFEDWLAAKSANYRSEMRRRRRNLARAGGAVRLSTRETVESDVATLMALHRGRWRGRGQSQLLAHEAETTAYFASAGRQLVESGAFRLVVVEVEGQAIAAQIHAAAGGEVLFINGGWDERFAKLSPSVLCLLAAVEDAFARGDQRFDLGPGDQPYKRRMADGSDPLAWTSLVVSGPRSLTTYASFLPVVGWRRARDFGKRALPEEQVQALRGWRDRIRPPGDSAS